MGEMADEHIENEINSLTQIKFYIVWEGKKPGIYTSWSEAEIQVKNFYGAKYKKFICSEEEAKKIFYEGYKKHSNFKDQTTTDKNNKTSTKKTVENKPVKKNYIALGINPNSICVDAACQGNPGILEYKGVDTMTQKVLFAAGPFNVGTNNIGEFLAIVHALAYCKQQNISLTIYSDSQTAIAWVKNKKANSNLSPTKETQYLLSLVDRAELWLKNNTYLNPIYKWDTKKLGEIPADYSRK